MAMTFRRLRQFHPATTAVVLWIAVAVLLLVAVAPREVARGAAATPATSPATFPATAPAAPSTQPADLRRLRGLQDRQVGQAIDRGVDFLLSQFRNGELSTVPSLSASQRQALDALCVYALVQASRASPDPRLSPRGKFLPEMLNRLRTFSLVSDAQKLNRPITYGRSLRAAALATLDRPEDRAVLKADVEWLIKAQIGGAYSYDDLYNDLLKQGMKSSSAQPPAHDWAFPPRAVPGAAGGWPASAEATAASPVTVQDFGGGSGDMGYGGFGGGGGAYGPPMMPLPPAMPPPILTPKPDPNPPKGPPSKPPVTTPLPTPPPSPGILQFTRPQMPSWPRPTVPWSNYQPGASRPPTPGGGSIGPSVKPKGAVPGGGGVYSPSQRPLGDNNIPRPEFQFQFPWDNSNSQYGLLGVWAGAEVGVEVPDAYWQAVEKHWLACELKDGQWGYHREDLRGTFAMNTAGVASLLVTHEYLDLPLLKGQVGREPYNAGLALGLSWFDKGNNGVDTPNAASHYFGYDLFGIERVGLASGYKYFGAHDWYRELCEQVVRLQFPNGAWGHDDHGIDTLVDTAYSLLFLARGRHPVLMTKLKFDRFWDNRPRDVANLAKFATKQLERQVNWQTVSIDRPWNDWFDSPVVYIASHQAPKLTPKHFAELQKFVLAGGLIFTQADVGSTQFDAWVPELAKRIAPGYPLRQIPESDPIYSLQYKLSTRRRLMGVSNGVRWLIVHSPNDLSLAWQQRSDKTRLQDFQLGLNIFFYAAGKLDLKNRIDSPFVPDPPVPPTRSTRVARVQYAGNWNPEPEAWGRFARWLRWETGASLETGAVAMDKLAPGVAPIAVLTGTGKPTFAKPQLDAAAAYVRAGGVLLIDAAGGDNTFRLAVRDSLLPAFADARPAPLPTGVTAPTRLRPYSLERPGRAAAQIQVLACGKGYLVISPIDLTHALLGTNTWAIDGYTPEAAQAFLKGLVAWADHQ